MFKRFLFFLAFLLILPVCGLSAQKVTDLTLIPKDHAIAYSFTAPEQDCVQIAYKSTSETGSILAYGKNGAFSGEIVLPLTYAGNNVTISILAMSGSKLLGSKSRTEYPLPSAPEEPLKGGPLCGITVCIDPGHQLNYGGGTEPVGPGMTGEKTIVFGMAQGVITLRKEATVVLEIGLHLRDELLKRGAKVVMTRDVMDKTMTNLERAGIANDNGADICLRLHCNAVRNRLQTGIGVYGPLNSDYARALADSNTYEAWGQALLDSMMKATGAQHGGVRMTDDYIGSNWCKMPVFLVEMGFMTNRHDDLLLSDPDYQHKLCEGMADGIEAIMRMRGLIK